MSTDWLLPFGVLLALATVLWGVSLAVRDTSIVDVFWGPMFVVTAGVGYLQGGGLPARKLIVLSLVTLWGLRLAAHLAFRSRGRGEDYRYREMREKQGARWWIVSLPSVFLLQAALASVVALPVQAAMRRGGDAPLSLLDLTGVLLFTVGFVVEASADWTLTRFRSRPDNRDRVLDQGLFRYSRHPNYFGDALLWWGVGAIGASAGAPLALVGSALMTFLLMRVSGVTLLERSIGERRPDYAAYRRSTNAFFPGPRRNSST
jgi:steroid 5-alpha reductase family enzyme